MQKELKYTEHPHYGEIVYTANGLLVCHICGKAFIKLGGHVWAKHRILVRDYCKMYGLDVGKGLCSVEHKKVLREKLMKHYDEVVVDNLIEGGRSSRFKCGGIGRPKSMVSEQTRRRLSEKGRESLLKNSKHVKRKKEVER